METFITVEAARALVLANAPRGPVETVPLREAGGRTLARPVVGREAIPPFDNAGMDGYAVRTADLTALPAELLIIEDLPAGTFPTRRVDAGTCARIMTGAPFPEGADAVVPVEATAAAAPGRVRILKEVSVGQHVRRAGQDVRPGEEVLAAGTVVTPAAVGLLATLGFARVPVFGRPSVAIVATGDELVDVGATPGPGQIRNANGPALAAQVEAAGGRVAALLQARDDRDATRAVLAAARAADVLVFSGGVSMGAYDVVREVLEAGGTRFLFWKVRQRPGKPLAFGVLDGRPVFGLPGNPVSASVCFEQYVRPALAQMLGRRAVLPRLVPAVLAAATPKKAGLHHFTRGIATVGEDGRLMVRDTGGQASNLYTSLAKANCLLHLPEALEDPPAGTRVEIEWLPW